MPGQNFINFLNLTLKLLLIICSQYFSYGWFKGYNDYKNMMIQDSHYSTCPVLLKLWFGIFLSQQENQKNKFCTALLQIFLQYTLSAVIRNVFLAYTTVLLSWRKAAPHYTLINADMSSLMFSFKTHVLIHHLWWENTTFLQIIKDLINPIWNPSYKITSILVMLAKWCCNASLYRSAHILGLYFVKWTLYFWCLPEGCCNER